MALMRRSLASLVVQFSRLALPQTGAAQQALGSANLSCLRSLALPALQPAAGSSWAAGGVPSSSRQFTAAAAPLQQAAAAAAAGQQAQEESLEQIQARIFGNHIGNGLRSGRKVLRRALVGHRVAAYYPEDPSAKDPLMLSFKAETAKLKLDRLRRRGKAPPKKGAGKRAGKKK